MNYYYDEEPNRIIIFRPPRIFLSPPPLPPSTSAVAQHFGVWTQTSTRKKKFGAKSGAIRKTNGRKVFELLACHGRATHVTRDRRSNTKSIHIKNFFPSCFRLSIVVCCWLSYLFSSFTHSAHVPWTRLSTRRWPTFGLFGDFDLLFPLATSLSKHVPSPPPKNRQIASNCVGEEDGTISVNNESTQ